MNRETVKAEWKDTGLRFWALLLALAALLAAGIKLAVQIVQLFTTAFTILFRFLTTFAADWAAYVSRGEGLHLRLFVTEEPNPKKPWRFVRCESAPKS